MCFLPHPPSSPPCLNPIKPVSNILKHRVASLRPLPTTPDALYETAVVIWDELDQEMIDRLNMSMPRRLDAVIEAEGGWIPH